MPNDLTLIATRPEDYQALGGTDWRSYHLPEGGLEPPEVLEMLAGWTARLHAAQGWGSWVAAAAGEVVASLAVKAPMQDGCVEIGYGVAPMRRGRGLATAAVLALLPLLAARGVKLVTAETALDNPASGRVLTRAGFVQTGQRIDLDDGAVIQWQRHL